MNIIIHWDFTLGNEQAYATVKYKLENMYSAENVIHTNCLDFFSCDYPKTFLVRSDFTYISVDELLSNKTSYPKEIRKAHNLQKMLVAGSFDDCWTNFNNSINLNAKVILQETFVALEIKLHKETSERFPNQVPLQDSEYFQSTKENICVDPTYDEFHKFSIEEKYKYLYDSIQSLKLKNT